MKTLRFHELLQRVRLAANDRLVKRFSAMAVYFSFAIIFAAMAGSACRSVDKTTQICGQVNAECHQSCGTHNNDSADFGQSKTATQWISQCDIRCEKNYQACLLRQRDKSLRGINE